MPGDFGVLVVTRVLFTTTKCTRDRGCIVRPAFPTPSLGRKIKATPRALRAASTKSYPEPYQRHCERSEAIHSFFRRRDGLLRRYAPRNDGSGGLTIESSFVVPGTQGPITTGVRWTEGLGQCAQTTGHGV